MTQMNLMKMTGPSLLLSFAIAIGYFAIATGCSKSDKTGSPAPGQPLVNMTDIQYGANTDTSGNTVALTLDLYYPAGATTARTYPLVVMIHGGSYINGDKADMKGNSLILADSGFVVASINYRLGWRNGTGTCDGDTASQRLAVYRGLQDGNAALRFLMAYAAKYAINTGWVFIGGNSAGSSLSLNTTYITDDVAKVSLSATRATLGPVNTAGNALTNTFKIKGVCNMWGALPDSTLITAASAVPAISFHGTADSVVPYDIGHNQSCINFPMLYGSACIHRRLLAYNTPVLSNFVIGQGHGPAAYTHEFLMSNTACFFKRLIKGTPITSQVYTTLVSSCN